MGHESYQTSRITFRNDVILLRYITIRICETLFELSEYLNDFKGTQMTSTHLKSLQN